MGFAFHQRGNVGSEIRRIATEQIDKAIEEAGAAEIEFAERIHRLRRRCKRLRGLLRLIRPRFKSFADENRAIRDIAAGLSGARDAAVRAQTFEDLIGRGAPTSAELVEAIRAHLRAEAHAEPDDAARQVLIDDFVRAAGALRERVAAWRVKGQGFNAIAEGLETTYRRMAKGMKVAKAAGSAEAFHAWRKDTKYHWHHAGLFEEAAPDVMGAQKEQLDRLAELLGDHHNLAVLGETLSHLDIEGVADLRKFIEQRQAELAGTAFALGRQLTAETAIARREHFAAYWRLLPKD